MKSTKEVRCEVDGRMLFKIIDNEYLEITCSKCGKKLLYPLPTRPLTAYKKSGRIIVENFSKK